MELEPRPCADTERMTAKRALDETHRRVQKRGGVLSRKPALL
jgi:hypothetical protein